MDIEIAGPAGPIPCLRADPPGTGPHPAVIVLEEIFGVNRYIQSVAERLAEAGFIVLAPEVYHREAPGFQAAYDAEGMAAGKARAMALDRAGFHEDFAAVLAATKADPTCTGKVGVIGFCFGGLLTWECHAIHRTDAAVSFYGRAHSPGFEGRAPLSRTGDMRGPILAHFASDDPSIPPEAVGACAAALVGAPVRGTIEVWPGTHHGFHCWDRAAYHEASARAAWAQSVRFFGEHLG